MTPTAKTYLLVAGFLIAVVFGAMASWFGAPIFPFGLCAYLIISLVPGAALYWLVAKETDLLEALLAALALSPILIAVTATGAMLAGVSFRLTTTFLLFLTCILGLFALWRRPTLVAATRLDRRHVLALLAVFLVVSVAISYPAFTRESWRMRSDAWFHGAVVAQITDFGIPPEDPYAVGLPLQYMWLYHVLIAILSQASGIGRFMVMALVNVQAIVGFGLAAFLLSSAFRKGFSHNYAATFTTIFGMNAAFWLFIPVRILRALFGEVRGTDDVARLLSLHPFEVLTVRRFVKVGMNQEFLLDKFMVATAFSMGLLMMAVLWWASLKYLEHEKKQHLLAAFLAAMGVVVFHTALGAVAFGGVTGGLVLLIVFKRFLKGFEVRPALKLLVVLVICGILVTPYLYSVTHAKTADRAIPLGFSVTKMIGIAVSCALVIFLSAFQARRIFRKKHIGTYFLVFTTASILGICAILNLPAANTYDKLPFLVFFPLAVVGGWTIAEFSERAATTRARVSRYALACLIAFGPLNILMFAAYYNTVTPPRLSETESKVAAWVSANTPRESMMIDSIRGGFLLNTGPRRYLLASPGYADIWGYDPSEIDRRKDLKRDLYSPGALEPLTLETLGSMSHPVYVIVRRGDHAVDADKFDRNTDIFTHVFTSGSISVFEIERSACLSAARASGHKG
ncbi:MAG: hypothetical protein JSW58_16790 [Candidatus Latescibacterota bacterium]|nr:MAG: hypothetical protein JSW58_16790 [Candidatus Latescibacterota bacterium]